MARSPILTSAQVVLYINGVMYGRVSSFRFNSDTPRKDIRGVDSVIPFELGLTTNKISCTMSVYRMSQDGGAEGAGLVAPVDELTREKYFTAVLIDISSGSVIFQAEFCSVDSQNWQFDARQVVQGQISFSALNWSNEVRPVG